MVESRCLTILESKSPRSMSAGLAPSEAVRASLFQVSLLASHVLLAIFDHPWLLHHPSSLALCVCVCVCPNFSFVYGHQLYWIKRSPFPSLTSS